MRKDQTGREGKPVEKGGWAKYRERRVTGERKSRRTDGGKGKEGRTKAGRKPDGERQRKKQAERNRQKGRLPKRIENGGQQRWKGEVDRER